MRASLEQNPSRLKEEEEVIRKFGSIFNPDTLHLLTKEQFKSFLLIKNNRHWEGIHRQGNIITEDMSKLKKALKTLLNEETSLKDRLDTLFPKNKSNFIKGLGRAIATLILMVVFPDKYGVYNKRGEAGLRKLGLHPEFKNESFAERYIKINSILLDIAKSNGVSLFQLDDMFGFIYYEGKSDKEEVKVIEIEGEAIEDPISFGLEKHLEDFLIDNWEKTSLGQYLTMYEEDGDIAQQYDAGEIGRIDILARDRKTGDWVIIELKKGRDSDKVVGQTLRYMGWVKQNKATKGENVQGIIIAGEPDERIKFALKPVPNIKFLIYEVKFNLKEL